MFPDYETPGSEPSGAPAFAAARAPESDAPAVVEPGAGAHSGAGGQGDKPVPANDAASAANRAADTSNGGRSDKKGSSLSDTPAAETPAARDESAETRS